MEFESDHADVAHHDAQPPFRLVKPDSPDRVDLVIRWAASMGLDTNRATIITYLFPIRDGVLASIELPADLTKGEPRRLAAFVDSLAIDGATDGDPRASPLRRA